VGAAAREIDFAALRERMVERHLRRRGIRDERVLEAMGRLPRERFVPAHNRAYAYGDHALVIGEGQTISQPYIVALTSAAAAVQPGERVLDVGTGSGYQAAVLAAMGAQVWSIERIPALARGAAAVLDALGLDVTVVVGDGSLGLPAHAPYDVIIVAARAPEPPPALLAQLAEGGRLVVPAGDGDAQTLWRITRHGDRFERESLGGVRFVPLIGAEGYDPAALPPEER
jgi:protein-L-isoaspartate(D-aspartate) O-methyltransferase